MPISLHVIRANDFVCIDADEHFNFEESMKALQGLAVACRKRALDRAMIDLRDLPRSDKPRFSNSELAALVGAFREAGCPRHWRLAILYRRDIYGSVRNFTFFSRMRGFQVQAFHDFESALHWLWQDTENQPEEKHGVEVPVLRFDAKKRTADLAGGVRSTAATAPAHRFKGKASMKFLR